jgi:pseudouridine synthase
VFDALPDTMPRVMSIGRLDLNSEGLLLLTNDGGIKRQLELPSTGWLRKYRVRIKGAPKDEALEPLRKGIEVEGVPLPADAGFARSAAGGECVADDRACGRARTARSGARWRGWGSR